MPLCRLQLLAGVQGRQAAFRSQAWYPLVWGRRALPVEPVLKVALTLLGIVAELWAGHTSYRCTPGPQSAKMATEVGANEGAPPAAATLLRPRCSKESRFLGMLLILWSLTEGCIGQ